MKTGGCPKCGGDIFTDDDGYETFEVCLQCGAETNRKPIRVKKTIDVLALESEAWAEKHSQLTERNREIKRLVDGGMTYKRAARKYGLSPLTVKVIYQDEKSRERIKKEAATCQAK